MTSTMRGAALTICCLALTACTNVVTIKYQPLLRTGQITGMKDGVAAGGKWIDGGEGWITIYKISEIENAGSTTFKFDPTRTFACSDDADGFIDKSGTMDYGRPVITKSNGSVYNKTDVVKVNAGASKSTGVRIAISHRRLTSCMTNLGTGAREYPMLSYMPTPSDSANFDIVIIPIDGLPVDEDDTTPASALP